MYSLHALALLLVNATNCSMALLALFAKYCHLSELLSELRTVPLLKGSIPQMTASVCACLRWRKR